MSFAARSTYPVPVRSMGGDGDVGGSTIDGVTVDVDRIVPHCRYECMYFDGCSVAIEARSSAIGARKLMLNPVLQYGCIVMRG